MASLFGARRRRSPEEDGEDDRSGSRRAQRRRLSPEEAAASPAEAPATGTSPGWLSGFVSGAKRVISSVLLFSSPEETGSGEDEEEEEDDDDEDEEGIGLKENEDIHDTHGAIVPFSESKLAIEQMVMKETFSRDECDRMVELIKSRIRDSTFPEAHEYGKPEETPSRNAGIAHDFTGTWHSLSRDRNFPESVPLSNMRMGPGSFSPGSPLQASPELCIAAVTEAKKWLEVKRQGLGLKPEDNGPCTLNTDIFSSHDDSDMGTPVDLAKSYMQSLPPWQSPFLGRQKFDTSPSKYSIASTEVIIKEDYLSSFWTKLEESRSAQIGSSGGSADAPKFWNYGSNSRLFENNTSIFSLGTDEKVGDPTKTHNGSEKVAATELVGGCSLPITPTEDRTDGITEPVDLENNNGNAPQEYQVASEILPDKVAEGKDVSSTGITKDTGGHSRDVKAPTSEPHIGETHVNSASESIPNDAGPPAHTKMNGSTKKTIVNGYPHLCKLAADDPVTHPPLLRETKDDFDTSSSTIDDELYSSSSRHREVIFGLARSIVSISSTGDDGLPEWNFNGIVIGSSESDERARILTTSETVCDYKGKLDHKLLVRLPNKVIKDGELLFFDPYYGLAILEISVDMPLRCPSFVSGPDYGDEVFVLTRNEDSLLMTTAGKVLWHNEPYFGRNHYLYLSCELPECVSGGLVMDRDGYIAGMTFDCASPKAAVLPSFIIKKLIEMESNFRREEILYKHNIDSGYLVDKVEINSTAEIIGIRRGDVIVSFNGMCFQNMLKLEEYLLSLGWKFLEKKTESSKIVLKLKVYDPLNCQENTLSLPLGFSCLTTVRQRLEVQAYEMQEVQVHEKISPGIKRKKTTRVPMPSGRVLRPRKKK